MIKIKLILALAITNLFFSIICMDDKNKQNNEKAIKALTLLNLTQKNNYLSEAIILPDLQRIVAHYACEWNCIDPQFAKLDYFERMILSPNGKYIASCGSEANSKDFDCEVKIYDFKSKECIQILNKSIGGHTKAGNTLDFSPNNRFIASAGRDKTIRIYDLISKKYTNVIDSSHGGHTDSVYCVKYSPDGKYIASVGQDTSIKIWYLNAQDIRPNLIGLMPISELEESIAEYASECSLLKTLSGHTSAVWKVVFSSNGEVLASGSQNGVIKIWDLKTHTCTFTYNSSKDGHKIAITDLEFSPNGQYLASSSTDHSIKLWDLKTNTCVYTFDNTNGGHNDFVTSLSYSLDGQYLFSGCTDGSIKAFSLVNNNCIFTKDGSNGGHSKVVRSLALSPDGQFLISCCTNEIKIWSNRELELLGPVSQN